MHGRPERGTDAAVRVGLRGGRHVSQVEALGAERGGEAVDCDEAVQPERDVDAALDRAGPCGPSKG